MKTKDKQHYSTGAAVAATLALCGAAIFLKRKLTSRLELAGKVVLITGSSRGLGLAMAEEFGRRGARLVLTARDPYELERALDLLVQRGAVVNEDAALIIPCDIRDDTQAREMIERATQHFGQIDILVNNAGIITVGAVEDQSLASFQDAMNTNFYGMLHCSLAVVPQMMARQSGSIVNICSIGGKFAVPHLLPYSASKFAAVGFSEGLHAELRSKGVAVTTVCPGLMRTGSHVRALFSGNREEEYRWFSLGASLPGVTASAEHAARVIMDATVTGATEITITPQAWLGARAMGLFPTLTQLVLHLSTFMLPPPSGAADAATPKEGREVRGMELSTLTALGTQASYHYNEGP